MSHRKFERPRSGSLAFAPRKRCSRAKGKIGSFPKDDSTHAPHLTAFIAYKAGMTHVVREVERAGSRLNKKEVVSAVSILEAPPMVCVGIVGYIRTTQGLKTLTTAWAPHLSEGVKRRIDSKYYKSKKNQFAGAKDPSAAFKAITEKCTVVRAIMHTQPELIKQLKQKKVHLLEVQVNGGSISDKVEFVKNLFEQEIKFDKVFQESECLDAISISRGHGMTGVITRWGVNRLRRKTHRGLRKVACIGAWHPARCQWTVPRAGQMGYHQRTESNKRIYRIGQKGDAGAAQTAADLTEKTINPMGGFPNYGQVTNDWIMIKGSVIGPKKRAITLRRPLVAPTSRKATEPINIKFIDTASQIGTGRYQTSAEKRAAMGMLKKRKNGNGSSTTIN